MKGRVILHSIFAYGIRQEWCDSNPVSRIEVPSIKEKPITPLSVQEVSRLRRICETEAHQSMRFSLHLMLYCGIRPTEVKRLKPSDICWEEHQVIIRPQVSKTGGGRAVPLRGLGNLTPHDCAIPRNWERRWQQLRRAAGFTRWVPDVCRHTFASYHAAHFRNLPALQLEMGHRDCSLLRSRYMVPARRSDAAHFCNFPVLTPIRMKPAMLNRDAPATGCTVKAVSKMGVEIRNASGLYPRAVKAMKPLSRRYWSGWRMLSRMW